MFRDLGDRHGQAMAIHNLGGMQRLTGDYPAAAASQQQALGMFRDLGDRYGARPMPSAISASCNRGPGTTRPPPPA